MAEHPCNCKPPQETLGGYCAKCKRRLRSPSEIRLATDVKEYRGARAKMSPTRRKPDVE